MDIGKEKEERVVEPLVNPVPREQPAPSPVPDTPEIPGLEPVPVVPDEVVVGQ